MSTRDGKVLGELPIGPNVDAIKVDGGEVFASTAGSQLFVARESLELVQTIETAEGARTMGVDPATHRIYLPSAEYETGADGKRVAKPNTFTILVIGR